MPGFFNSLTQAVGSYLRNLKQAATDTVTASFDDLDLGDPLSGQRYAGTYIDVITDPPIEPATDDTDPSAVSSFVDEAQKGIENLLQPENVNIGEQPRGIKLALAAVVDRIAEFLPKSRGSQPPDTTSVFRKITDVLSRGLSLDRYRPDIVNGRLIGKHTKLYMLLSYLNEFVNPRGQSIDLLAYFRDSVDSVGKAFRDTALHPGSVGLSTPTILSVLANALRNPARMQEVLRGIGNIGSVDRAKFLQIADQYLIEARARMRGAAEDLAAGRITIRQYKRTMLQEIKRTTLAQVILNIGGVGNLTDEIMHNVHSRISQDIRGLDAFIREIKERGSEEENLFSTDSARRPVTKGKAPQVDADTLDTISSSLAALPSKDAGVSIDTDSYVEDGVLTASDLETSGNLAEGGYLEGQLAFRTTLAQNANEYQLLEVRRLEEGIENCEFCIGWADKPLPPGQLPDIGDPGCLGVKYGTGGCHCKMDTATEDEVRSAMEGAGDDNG